MNSKYFLIGLVFFSSVGFSCPDLTGQYLCSQTQFSPATMYSYVRESQGSNWLYKVTARVVTESQDRLHYEVLADAVEREVVDSISHQRLMMSATCRDDVLDVNGTAGFDKPHPIHFSEVLNLNSAGDLHDVSQIASGGTMEETCVRQTRPAPLK